MKGFPCGKNTDRGHKKSCRVYTDENGSIIVIALVVLVLMTLAGISATHMSVTESYIVRNTAINNQNLQLAESAAREGLRRILNRDHPADLATDSEVWMLSRSNDPDKDDESELSALARGNKLEEAKPASESAILGQRGESNTLWYYFVGWDAAKGSSLKTTQPQWQAGKVVGFYNSSQYGRAAVELGVLKRF